MTPQEREILLAQAAEAGARKALESLGLSDPQAAKDIMDLRDLIANWREVKKEVGRSILKMFGRLIVLILFGTIIYGSFKYPWN